VKPASSSSPTTTRLAAMTAIVAAVEDASRVMAEMAQFPEMNPAPVFRLDLEGRVLLANRAAREIFGREDLIGRSWLEICPAMGAELWRRIRQDPEPPQHEVEVGDRRLLFTFVRPELGAQVFAYGADVTRERWQAAELALQARFPDMNPGPVLRLDLDANVLLANRAAREVFGEKVVERCWRDLLPGLDEARWKEVVHSRHPVNIEAAFGDRVWVFAHVRDQ